MKTTVDLPDDLTRAVKIRAVEENRRFKDTIADLLRRGLAKEERRPAAVRRRLELPLVECAHEARPGEEMIPERVADVPAFDEEAMRAVVGCARGRLRKTSAEWLDETRGPVDERDR
jgi:plasmid stability protein